MNGQTGVVVLDASDVGADPAGTAAGLVDDLSGVTNAATARTNLGLGNVDNTSDANKPVSTAQQTALDGKAAASRAPHPVRTSRRGPSPRPGSAPVQRTPRRSCGATRRGRRLVVGETLPASIIDAKGDVIVGNGERHGGTPGGRV